MCGGGLMAAANAYHSVTIVPASPIRTNVFGEQICSYMIPNSIKSKTTIVLFRYL